MSNSQSIPDALAELLRSSAEKYENGVFADDDPIGTLQGLNEPLALEAAAFTAAALSYGSRKQFIPKILEIFNMASGDVHKWIVSGDFEKHFKRDDTRSFYRLFSFSMMSAFFSAYAEILHSFGTLGNYLQISGGSSGLSAVEAICKAFAGRAAPVIPKDATSPCKRICMFLRWMVRDSSPVDFGLWHSWFDKSTLIIPLDVHVLSQARKFGIVNSKSASMRTAIALTESMRKVFPDDPCKGDFALYGLDLH